MLFLFAPYLGREAKKLRGWHTMESKDDVDANFRRSIKVIKRIHPAKCVYPS